MSERGKFIVIEGIDGAGKGTQTDLLVDRLNKEGWGVVKDDYPHYETGFWGRQVGRMLAKEWGNPMEVSPYLTVLPYMLDEAEGGRKIIEPALVEGKIVVSNRYFTSNVHQIAKMPEDKREEYAEWSWRAGYEEMGIIVPDMVVVLLVDPPVCRENVKKKAERIYTKGQSMDAAEEDYLHQMESAKEYRKMVEKEPERWTLVDCCDEGEMRSKEEIHELIWQEIKKRKII